MSKVNELLEIAIIVISNIDFGILRNLFKGYQWNRISRSDRLLLGTLLLNCIITADNEVTPIEKFSPSLQRYNRFAIRCL